MISEFGQSAGSNGEMLQVNSMENLSSKQRQRLIEGRERLVDILSKVSASEKPVWTRELAEEIDLKVGQYLGDEVQIKQLMVPTKEQFLKQSFNPLEGFGNARKIDQDTLRAFNMILRGLMGVGIKSLGELREHSGFRYRVWVGYARRATFSLAKAAFARPQSP